MSGHWIETPKNYNETFPFTKVMLRNNFDGRNSVIKFKKDTTNVKKHLL